MENFAGQTVLDQIVEQTYITNTITARSFEPGIANELLEDLSTDRINIAKADIAGGIENDGQTISLEIAPEILPLRYLIEYKKLIRPEEEIKNPQVILVFESANISKSKMKISQLGTLQEFLDDRRGKLNEIIQLIEEDYEIDSEKTKMEEVIEEETELED